MPFFSEPAGTKPRFITQHPVFGPGLFLAKPGIDGLASANPADFLLHSGYKNEQVVKSGALQVGGINGQAVVLFAEILPAIPTVVYQFSGLGYGVSVLPWHENVGSTVFPGLGSNLITDRTYRVDAQVERHRVVFISKTVMSLYLQYMVLARSMD